MSQLLQTQQFNVVQILHHYINKYAQPNSDDTKDLLYQFQLLYQQQQKQYNQQRTIFKSQIFINIQNIQQHQASISNLEINLERLKQQRMKIYGDMDKQESELQNIEKQIQNMKICQVGQKLEDLIEGVNMCKEKCVLLEEENQEFSKQEAQLRQEHSLKQQHYQLVTKRYEINLETLQQLEQHGQEINYKMMKQLKIINDLRYFIKSKQNDTFNTHNVVQQKRLDNFISDCCNLENTYSYNNFDSLRSANVIQSENELADSLSTLIRLKNHLAVINFKDLKDSNDCSPKQKKELDQILISSNFRFKTHHNLGQKKHQYQKQHQDYKAFSDLDEEEEVQKEDDISSVHHEEISSFKPPDMYKSAGQKQIKNEIKWDCGSEKKKYCITSRKSFSSMTSNSTQNRLGVMTLKEEFQSLYQQQEVQEEDDLKEKDTEINDSGELPQLIQQEQIIENQTILINHKQKKQITIQPQNNNKTLKTIAIMGSVVTGFGLAAWLWKKYV